MDTKTTNYNVHKAQILLELSHTMPNTLIDKLSKFKKNNQKICWFSVSYKSSSESPNKKAASFANVVLIQHFNATLGTV